MDSYGLSFKMWTSPGYFLHVPSNKGKDRNPSCTGGRAGLGCVGCSESQGDRESGASAKRSTWWRLIVLIYVYDIYIYVCGCVLHIRILYICIYLYYVLLSYLYLFSFLRVFVCVCVRSVACGRPNPQDRDVLTSELMDLDPHKLLTLVKRIWRYWKLTANRRSSVITRYNKPSGKSSRFITLGYVGVFFHTFSHVFTFILAMACWLDRRSCQRTSRA